MATPVKKKRFVRSSSSLQPLSTGSRSKLIKLSGVKGRCKFGIKKDGKCRKVPCKFGVNKRTGACLKRKRRK